jgi:hypothetical protein
MIGAMVAYTVIVTLVGANTGLPPVAIVLLGLLAAFRSAWASATLSNASPIALAPRTALGAADHRDRPVDHPAAPGADHLEPQPAAVSADHQDRFYHITATPDGATITNVQVAIIAGSLAMMGGLCCSCTGRSSASRCAPRRRTRRSRASWASTSTG